VQATSSGQYAARTSISARQYVRLRKPVGVRRVEDHVAPSTLAERAVDNDAELCRGQCDRSLGDVPFLVGRKHRPTILVVRSDDS